MKALPTIGLSLLIFTVLVAAAPAIVRAQSTTDVPTQMTSDDFPRSRDITTDVQSGKTIFAFPGKKKPTFRLRRTIQRTRYTAAKKTVASKRVDPLPIDKTNEIVKQLGLTIWRLEKVSEKAEKDNTAARLLVQESAGPEEYLPHRITADSIFQKGDMLRLSFESPGDGYLYVIDRELYNDGTVGEAYQIFPTMTARGGNNRVQAGVVIDVPAQTDQVPYFKMSSADPRWRGELLTVIVSPEPLAGMAVISRAGPISGDLVSALEDKYLRAAGEYEQDATVGGAYTKAEQAAGAEASRQLTQGDPYPQTVYRVKTGRGNPMVMSLPLKVKN